MTRAAEANALPFSRPLAVAEVPPEGFEVSIRADAKECAALARANDLAALTRLEANFEVQREGPQGVKVAGELRADVRQTCVVTLEEFDSSITEPIEVRFAPQNEPPVDPPLHKRRARVRDEDREVHPPGGELDEDAPDPLVGGVIDLGAVASEFLTLSLDPYSRKPGASFVEPAADEDNASDSPFAKLRSALKTSGPSGDL